MKSSTAKSSAARKCMDAYPRCVQSCRTSADTYSETESWSHFNSLVGKCVNLSSKATALNSGSSSSLAASDRGLECETNSAEASQAGGGAGSSEEARQAAAARSAQCASNPSAPGCESTQPQYASARAATAGFNEVTAGKGSFDVPDTSAAQETFPMSYGGDQSGGAAPKNGVIANNSGGSIPGGAGGSAKTGGEGGLRGAINSVVSTLADIDKGYLGGGFSQLLQGEASSTPDSYGGGAGGRAVASEKPVDLRRYLPGGDLAGERWRTLPKESQFHGPGVNIFSRIHNRYEAKCRLGELFDCR